MPKYLDATGLSHLWSKIKARVYLIQNYARGTTDISIRPLVSRARANRLMFLPASQIIIENSTDGGQTWTDAGYTDAQKIKLFSGNNNASISIPLLNGEKSDLCSTRITITAMKYDVPVGTAETQKYNYWGSSYVTATERYFNVREWWFWLSANNDTIKIKIENATGSAPNTWVTVFNEDYGFTGWSGSDWIRAGDGATFGGSIRQIGNNWNWRLTFTSKIADNKTVFQSATQQQISAIACYGDNVWTTPNSFMANDHIYSWNDNGNVTFSKKVTATGGFTGALTGNVTGNLTGNVTGNCSGTVNNHTVNSDVPADAVFTDTTYSSMTQAQATAGTGTDGMLISPKVLIDTIGSNVTVVVEDNKIKITSR